MKKIKVFLGGYVNFQNAQNLNCRALSEHLDKEKFDVWTMLYWHQNAKDFEKVPGVHYLKSRRPVRFLGWIPYFWGIMRSDVAYLPKGEYKRMCWLFARLFSCRLFTTLEGVLTGTNLSKQKYPVAYINGFRKFEPNLYAITNYLVDIESKRHGLNIDKHVLYLGVEFDRFFIPNRPHSDSLGNIVFIGNNIKYKGIEDFLQIAEIYPQINFHVVGGNQMKDMKLEDYVKQKGLLNIIYHGVLDHTRLKNLLRTIDLMFFPSHCEGFGKVTFECACAGVPTLCYGDYGADEWITTGKDGFVVNTFDEAKSVIQNLAEHPEQLVELSKNAIELGKRFDWSVLVKEWESEIIRLANENKRK